MGAGYESHDEVREDSHRRQMEVHFGPPTPRERYRASTQLAATQERAGELLLACRAWQAAAELAFSHADRHWCESRAHHCARHVKSSSNV